MKARHLIEKRRRQVRLGDEIESLKTRAALLADLQNMLFHELRNQMLVIRGFSTLLGKNLRGGGKANPTGYADAIRRSSEFLGNLAEEVLLAGKLESGPLELPSEIFDLGRVLADTVDLYRPLAEEKGISFCLESCPSTVPAAVNRVAARMVISNLLDNAIKYSPERTSVKIRLQPEGSDHLNIQVEDGGPGILAQEAERIFEKFFRGHESEGKTRGFGLGLYLTKILTEAMGGSIGVESLPGQGSCFTVRLPAGPSGGSECRERNPLTMESS